MQIISARTIAYTKQPFPITSLRNIFWTYFFLPLWVKHQWIYRFNGYRRFLLLYFRLTRSIEETLTSKDSKEFQTVFSTVISTNWYFIANDNACSKSRQKAYQFDRTVIEARHVTILLHAKTSSTPSTEAHRHELRKTHHTVLYLQSNSWTSHGSKLVIQTL